MSIPPRAHQKRLDSELAAIQRDGPQEGITLNPVPATNLRDWKATIRFTSAHYPDSPYDGGTYEVYIHIPDEYPKCPPSLVFHTKIDNPHVDPESGEVGFSLLHAENWSPACTLYKLMLSLVVELLEPEEEYVVNEEMMDVFVADKWQYYENAREWVKEFAGEGKGKKEVCESVSERRV